MLRDSAMLHHDQWCGRRVGEASNPGPAGSRKTIRVRKEKKEENRNAEEPNIEGMLRPMIEKIIKSVVTRLLGNMGGDLPKLLGLATSCCSPGPPPQPEKPKKPKKEEQQVKIDSSGKGKGLNAGKLTAYKLEPQKKSGANAAPSADKKHQKESSEGWTVVSRQKVGEKWWRLKAN